MPVAILSQTRIFIFLLGRNLFYRQNRHFRRVAILNTHFLPYAEQAVGRMLLIPMCVIRQPPPLLAPPARLHDQRRSERFWGRGDSPVPRQAEEMGQGFLGCYKIATANLIGKFWDLAEVPGGERFVHNLLVSRFQFPALRRPWAIWPSFL